MRIHFLAGPPFGPELFDGVRSRLQSRGIETTALDPFKEAGGLAELIDWLSNYIEETDVLIAHGSAVPLAASFTSTQQIKTLFLSNGPLQSLDPVFKSFSKIPYALKKMALFPFWAIPALRSSAGLRRLVVNPYVMDHDTIVRVCNPLISSRIHRKNYAQYLGEIEGMLPISPPNTKQTFLVWGDSDLLYTTQQASSVSSSWNNLISIEIEGAKHLHPIEAPWALADHIADNI